MWWRGEPTEGGGFRHWARTHGGCSNTRRLLERTARSNARCARTGVVTQSQVHDAVADGAVAIVRSCPIGDAAFVRSALGASV